MASVESRRLGGTKRRGERPRVSSGAYRLEAPRQLRQATHCSRQSSTVGGPDKHVGRWVMIMPPTPRIKQRAMQWLEQSVGTHENFACLQKRAVHECTIAQRQLPPWWRSLTSSLPMQGHICCCGALSDAAGYRSAPLASHAAIGLLGFFEREAKPQDFGLGR